MKSPESTHPARWWHPLPAEADKLPDTEKGKILLDSITFQMRRELNSTFGWSLNDIIFNRFIMDNRAYRQYGVYHATRVLLDLYSSQPMPRCL